MSAAGSPLTRLDTTARYSEAVVHGGVVYLAGQVATPDALGDIRQQATSVMEQMAALLGRVGSDMRSLLSATVYLTDIADYAGMNEVWEKWVPPGTAPARTTIAAIVLAKPEYRIEITATAAIAVAPGH